MAKAKLFYIPGACSLATHILLREVDADFSLSKEQVGNLSQDLLKLNPKAKVPTVELTTDDGHEHVITEGPAIMTAISQLPSAQGKNLLGKTPMDVVRTYEWMNWLSGTVHGQAYSMWLGPQRWSTDPAGADGIKAKGAEMIKQCYQTIDEKLAASAAASGSKYAVGDSLTIVDLYLLVQYRWGKFFKSVETMDAYPAYTAHAREVSKRKSVVAALEAEQIPPTFADA